MKQLLRFSALLFFCFSMFGAQAQTLPAVIVSGVVVDTNGNPVANHLLVLSDSVSSGLVGSGLFIDTLYTGANGIFYDTIPLHGIVGHLTLTTQSCNGICLFNSMTYTPNQGALFAFTSSFTVCGTGSSSLLMCHAEFIIDTAQTTPGVVNLFNTSYTGGIGAGSAAMTYAWTFGDGGVGTGPYPSHFYSNAGTYQICVTLAASVPGSIMMCTDTYCDSLTVDQNGNIVYKGMTGFQLNVLNMSSMGQLENRALQPLRVHPNPIASGELIHWSAEGRTEIMDALGRLVFSDGTTNSASTAGWKPGIYVVRVTQEEAVYSERFIVR